LNRRVEFKILKD